MRIRSIAIVWVALVAVFAAQAQTDYKTLHNLLIKFYGFQRAGDKAVDNKNPFYKKGAPYPHSQDNQGGTDLSGGWYDAGDFVKFGLPFGFTTYCLLKGYDVFPRGYDDLDSWDYRGTPDNIPDILGEVKIATDYIIKAVISANSVVTDVGNGSQDHQGLGEDGYANSQRTSPRTATMSTGADIAGLYSASLALMSYLYKKHDATYAAKCLAKAQEAYTFGKANPKLSAQQNNGEYYKTDRWEDKMAAAAIELYRATGTASYLAEAKTYLGKSGSHFFVLSYAYLGDISFFEYKRQTGENVEAPWFTDVTSYLNRKVVAANASPLIKGAYIRSDWGNAGHAGSAALSAGLAFTITGDNRYLDFARSQVHWVAGIAPSTQSYVVGFGPNAPTAPHHRNDNTIGKSSGPRLKGGVVSGPTPGSGFDPAKPEASTWSFNGGSVDLYQNTEVALDYNAGMIGAVAFLRDYDNPPTGLVRISEALKVTPGNVDLNTAPAAITATFEATQSWKLVLTGRQSHAKRTLTGSGNKIAATWGGEADSLSFQVGEGIDMVIDIPNIATYHMIRAKTNFFLVGGKKETFKPTDILVDDFEDGDAVNAQKGNWSVFTDKAFGGTSSTNPPTLATAIIAKEGDEATKGMSIRFIGGPGAVHPMSGVRSTFNATGTAVSLGKASGVVFDIKAAVGDSIWVELEQSDISDSAYYAKRIDFASANWSRMRIPFGSFAQPAWKKSATPLNTGKIISLRFTSYSATGTPRINIDNLRVENLEIGGSPIRSARISKPGKIGKAAYGSNGLEYSFTAPENSKGHWSVEVSDVFGHSLAIRDLGELNGTKMISLNDLRLGKGWYFLRHRNSIMAGDWIQRLQIGESGR